MSLGISRGKAKKRLSRRVPLKRKFRLIKLQRAKSRKEKKDRKKNPHKYHRKDPGIPNSLPFKTKILDEMEQAEIADKEQQARKREELRNARVAQKENINARRITVEDAKKLVQSAEERAKDFAEKEIQRRIEKGELTDTSVKAYYKEFRKVVEAADVVLEVLDARDPLGTRVPQAEELVTSREGKRLVLVLNKSDLVPRQNLQKWLKYLRREFPTIVFKASTQTQNKNLSHASKYTSGINSQNMNSSRCLGADTLMQLLKNYCRNEGVKTAIAVGVVGLPNVGKSSIINSMKRSKACIVGAMPGVTKNMQSVELDSKVRLIDCPGIIFPGENSSDAQYSLRNSIKLQRVADLIKPVQAILSRVDKIRMVSHYKIAEYKDTHEFLVFLAQRLGKLKRGGIPDVEAAARHVLQDWNVGKIKYYTEPPEIKDTQLGGAVLSKFSQEFDIDSLQENETTVLESLPFHRPHQVMCVKSAGVMSKIDLRDDDDDDQEEMEEGENEVESKAEEVDDAEMCRKRGIELLKSVHVNIGQAMPKKAKKTKEEPSTHPRQMTTAYDPDVMSLGKFQKLMQKKKRKLKNRNVRNVDKLTDAFEAFAGPSTSAGTSKEAENYDFSEHFE